MKRKRTADTDELARHSDSTAIDSETAREEELAEIGRKFSAPEYESYYALGPELSAGDVDASWQEAEDSGAESPGGHVAIPDQDSVDEIGRAVGIEFQDNQELFAPEEVLSRRDRRRWELDKRSADGESL